MTYFAEEELVLFLHLTVSLLFLCGPSFLEKIGGDSIVSRETSRYSLPSFWEWTAAEWASDGWVEEDPNERVSNYRTRKSLGSEKRKILKNHVQMVLEFIYQQSLLSFL